MAGPAADESATVPAVLALLEATERHGHVVARLPVTRWPVTVGRDLRCDLVLDDPHVAAQHLGLVADPSGSVAVRVLDTRNGVVHGRRHHGRGDTFAWSAGESLSLGRLQLRLRLAAAPLAAELELPGARWRHGAGSLAALWLLLVVLLAQLWLRSTDTDTLLLQTPAILGTALFVLFTWAGLWALATRLFSGHAQFWRHVRIAAMAYVAVALVDFVVKVLAFSLSWENLSRFGFLLLVLLLVAGIYRHVLVAAPQARRGLVTTIAALLLLGGPAALGMQWLQNKRLSNQLYMADIFPPGWRLAAPVPVEQFLQEAADIEKRLSKRLQDAPARDAADEGQSDEE